MKLKFEPYKYNNNTNNNIATMIDNRIQKSVVTISEMMRDRGFDSEADTLLSLLIEDNPSFNIDIGEKFRIIYNLNSKIKIADIKKFVDGNCDFYIVVLSDKLSPANIKLLNEPKYDIQVFELKELSFNISKHSLVPKHILIKDEKIISKLVSNYQLKSKSQFPIILKTDPMAKYFNAKSGDLLKIIRYSPSAGEHIAYRCCV